MKINKVTFTGADNQTNIKELFELQEKYPFVEWGILFSQKKAGEQRYPTLDYVKQLTYPLELSAHFCGWYSREVIENHNFNLINDLSEPFRRVQLNYNFKDSKTIEELFKFVEVMWSKKIILQYNENNKKFIDNIIYIPKNVNFLYDNSGGRGIAIQEIENPIESYYTGYSGGLNEENIESICQSIIENKNNCQTWIDIETGVRTDEEFDLQKVRKILEKIERIIL